MKRFFAPAAAAAAILLSSVSVDAILAPAQAQDMDVSFDSFHDYLANYGDWVYSDRWGEVWVPENVPDDFQPYGTNGYWAATDNYGWVWVSNYEWGDVPFHYGRWVNDPDIGWLWIPGYVWSPAWVAWRHNGNYTGWMPMPPDPEFLGQSGPSLGIGISLGGGLRIGLDFNDTSSYYGYSQWYPDYDESRFARNWVFLPTGHLADRDSQRYWAPRGGNVTIIHNTTNITNYTVVNNYVVNRGVDVRVVEKAGGHPIQHVQLAQVMKHPGFVAQANRGAQIQARMRQENPRGNGMANSAPKPSDKLVQGLSNKVPQHAGHAPMHVFTKQTVSTAPAFTGKPTTGGAMHGPGGNMSGPALHQEHKPTGTGGGAATGAGGMMMRGQGSMNAPEQHAQPGGGAGGAMSAPMMMHKHENTGGGGTPGGAMMQGPGSTNAPEHHTQPTGNAGGAMGTPMMHKHENTGGGNATGGEAIGAGGPVHTMERKPATAPVEHAVTPHNPPAEHAPPQKGEEKKDKGKPEH